MKITPIGQTIAPTWTTAPDGRTFIGLEYQPRREGEGLLVPTVLKNVWCGHGQDNEYAVDLARLGPSPVVVDLGANVGSFTMGIAACIPGAQVLAVEPSLLSYGCLVANILAGSLEGRVVPARYAVSDQNATCILIENLTGSCVVSYDELKPGLVFGGGLIGVYGRTVQWLLDEHEIAEVDFMKVDLEGSEVRSFLATPPETMRRIKQIAMEIHAKPGEDEMIAHIGETHTTRVHGYLFAERR